MRRRTANCCLLGYFVGFGFVEFDFDLMKHLRRYCHWVSGSGSYLGAITHLMIFVITVCRLGIHLTFSCKVKSGSFDINACENAGNHQKMPTSWAHLLYVEGVNVGVQIPNVMQCDFEFDLIEHLRRYCPWSRDLVHTSVLCTRLMIFVITICCSRIHLTFSHKVKSGSFDINACENAGNHQKMLTMDTIAVR